MPVVLDNNKLGAVGEYIKENIKCGAEITISSPIFTIYCYAYKIMSKYEYC